MRTVQTLIQRAILLSKGADINKIQLDTVMNLAKDELLTLIRPISMVSEATVENGVFGDEYRFEVPADMNEDYAINLRRCNETSCCFLWNRQGDWDGLCDKMNIYDVAYVNGYKYLQVNPYIDPCECGKNKHNLSCLYSFRSTAEMGNWLATGGITSLSDNGENVVLNLKSNGSLINPEGASIGNTDLPVFWEVIISEPRLVDSITIFIGSSPTDGYTATVNRRHNGPFVSGLNLLRFKLEKVGIPNIANLNYWKVDFNTNDMERCNDCGPLVICLGCLNQRTEECFKLKYYSTAIFRDNKTGERFIDIKDSQNNYLQEIILDEEAFIIYTHLVAEYLKWGGIDDSNNKEFNKHEKKITEMVDRYKQKHKDIVQRQTTTKIKGIFEPYSNKRAEY